MSSRALFLDRDGVINEDAGYVCRKEDFRFMDGIFELVAKAKANGYLVVVVTNQAGIGRGYYTEDDFNVLMDWVRARFQEKCGDLDAIYFCPDHPVHGIGVYRRNSNCRKPAPGMLHTAIREWDIDVDNSILIGDKMSDIQAGIAAGVGTNLLFRNHLDGGYQQTIFHLMCAVDYLSPSGSPSPVDNINSDENTYVS